MELPSVLSAGRRDMSGRFAQIPVSRWYQLGRVPPIAIAGPIRVERALNVNG